MVNSDTGLNYILKPVSGHGVVFDHHLTLAKDIRAGFEEALLHVMYDCCPSSHSFLSEVVQDRGWVDWQEGEMRSFACVAASVCLRDFRRYKITTFGQRILPRIGEL